MSVGTQFECLYPIFQGVPIITRKNQENNVVNAVCEVIWLKILQKSVSFQKKEEKLFNVPFVQRIVIYYVTKVYNLSRIKKSV